jgi:divalent metal cation (Fe/Co/Zn/Cd) transporter
MPRAVGLVVGLALLASGVLLGLYGLFAILYGGDSGGTGDTYVTIAGHETDADLAGALALLVAFFLLLASLPFVKRERRLPK